MNTPDISDRYPDLPFLLNFKSFGGVNNFSGEVVTLKCDDDNSLVRSILSEPGQSRVLFVDGNASENVALLGDNLASLAIENNWSAVVIYGCVRDVVELQQLSVAVFALNSCPKKSKKNNTGTRSIDLHINNVLIKEGCWLYGDQNGILVSPEKLT
ncbi:MAG: ribonuclease E activity regulator RraA [SAR86 cluster bacterium]|jgi:regulator of ribonuclease activity A|nr:ribonuclease E activity regulator RraA [SAR86 cluster bacterium]MBL6811166.1 ribonuclease E activity regulator RraA [SAR86 cluster bacterium]